MRFEADAVLRFDRETAFAAWRDELPALCAYLPNVQRIEVVEREQEGPIVRLVNVWTGGGEIPAAVRSILRPEMLQWTDHATWDAERYECDWTIRSHAFPEAVRARGLNRFISLAPDRTRLEIRGEIEIDLPATRLVPGVLAATLGRTVEQFLARQIAANVTSVSTALARHLEHRERD
ncbi:MAG: hypothetical protein NZ898_00980 [Myxococcota bacterium]|nr:hypothetical protein [Myxococcota bacterium]MDW8360832.1 hypothetical protein [Myxococcales bacterium]